MDCTDVVIGSFVDCFTDTYMHVFRWSGKPHPDTRLDCNKAEWANPPIFGQSNQHDL